MTPTVPRAIARDSAVDVQWNNAFGASVMKYTRMWTRKEYSYTDYSMIYIYIYCLGESQKTAAVREHAGHC